MPAVDLRLKEASGRPPDHLENDQPQVKDTDFATLLDNIGGSIQGRAVAEGPTGKVRLISATTCPHTLCSGPQLPAAFTALH